MAVVLCLLVGFGPASGARAADGALRSFDRTAATAAPEPPAVAALRRRLGPEGSIVLSGATGTPRHVGRTDRALTGPSARPAVEVVLDYVRAHRAAFRLSDRAIASLGPPQVVVSPNGTRHLRWRQRHGGVPIVGAELRAHVAADGRLLAVQGGPSPLADRAPALTPTVSASTALERARRVGGLRAPAPAVRRRGGGTRRAVRFADGSRAALVFAATRTGPRLAWDVRLDDHPDGGGAAALVAADDGTVLARHALSFGVGGHADVWDARPSDPRRRIAFPDRWVTTTTALRGDFAYVFADVLEQGVPSVDAEGHGGDVPASGTAPDGAPTWFEPFAPFADGTGCAPLFPCSWSSAVPFSWRANLRQSAVQAFTYINRFHDHLAAPPIGFDAASGNFETATPGGTDGDPVVASVLVGAALDDGLPVGRTRNNARMFVPEDGRSPHMSLFLFVGQDDPFPLVDGHAAEHASIVYHEYGHGLTGRLVTRENGVPALTIVQAAAIGEGVSDWYALDYLEATGALVDDPAVPGELLGAAGLTRGETGLRHAAIDCPVEATGADRCPAGGGFTYAQFARIAHDEDGPTFEQHADGEIIAQTLWDLRTALIAAHGRQEGIRRARELVTEGLRLTPPEPTFLELRDAILIADVAAGGRDRDRIWAAFAARGMGYRAQSYGPAERTPRADFSLPPPPPRPPDPPATDGPPSAPVAPPHAPPPAAPPLAPTPAGPSAPPAPSDPAAPPRLRGRLAFPAGALARMRSRRGVPLRLRVDAPARVVATLALPAASARRLGLTRRRRGTVPLARATVRQVRPGRPHTVWLRLGARARKRLATTRRLRVILTVTVTDDAGRRTTRTARPLLRAARRQPSATRQM